MSDNTVLVEGQIEQAPGAPTGNEPLQTEGRADQAVSKIEAAKRAVVDKVKKAARKAVDKVTRRRSCC